MLHRQSIRKLIQRSALRNRTGLRKRCVAIGVSMFMAWSVPNAIAQHHQCDACQTRTATHGHGSDHCNHCDGGGVSIPSLQTLIIDKLSAAGDRFERNHAARSLITKARTHRAVEPTCAANSAMIPSSLRFTKAKEPSCGVEAFRVPPKLDNCDAKALWGRAGVGSTGSLTDLQAPVIQNRSIPGSPRGIKTDSAKSVATQQSSDEKRSVPPDVAAALEHDSDSAGTAHGSSAPKLIPPPANRSSVPTSTELDEASSDGDEPPVPPQVPQTLEAISKSLDAPQGIESKSGQLRGEALIPLAPIESPKVLEKSPPLLDSVPPAPLPKSKSALEPSEADPLPDILVDPFIEDARNSKPKSPGRVELSAGKGQLKPLTLGSPSQNPINKLRQAEGVVRTSLRSGEITGDDAGSRSNAPKRLSQSQKDAGERQAGEEGATFHPAQSGFIPVNGLRSN